MFLTPEIVDLEIGYHAKPFMGPTIPVWNKHFCMIHELLIIRGCPLGVFVIPPVTRGLNRLEQESVKKKVQAFRRNFSSMLFSVIRIKHQFYIIAVGASNIPC